MAVQVPPGFEGHYVVVLAVVGIGVVGDRGVDEDEALLLLVVQFVAQGVDIPEVADEVGGEVEVLMG